MGRPRISTFLILFALLGCTAPASASVTASATSYEQNDSHTQLATASADVYRQMGGAPGSSAASATAGQGALVGISTMTGCGFALNNFQQPCNDARTTSSFTDTLNVTANAPNGTPVQVRVTLTLDGNVDGIGYYSYNTSAQLHTGSQGIAGGTGGTVQTRNNFSLDDSRTFVVNLVVGGTNYLFGGLLQTNVGNRWCAGGSSDCGPSATTWTMTLNASTLVQLEVLDPVPPGIHILGKRGHDYLTPPLAVAPPLPPSAMMSAPWPNPSRDAVSFDLVLAKPGSMDVAVYDLAGRRVTTLVRGQVEAGTRTLRWDGRDTSGRPVRGMFFVRVNGGETDLSRRKLLIR